MVNPVDDVNQDAGNNSAFGNFQIQAQLSDAYNNFASSGGIVVQVSTFNVSGSTGTISFTVGASSANPPVPAWTAVTDSSGSVGKSVPLFYYVSHHAGDYAELTFSALVGSATITNTTGRITTTGETPTQLTFLSPPTQETAGQTYQNPTIFTLERLDDFNNPSALTPQTITLDIPANQSVVHNGRGFYLSTAILNSRRRQGWRSRTSPSIRGWRSFRSFISTRCPPCPWKTEGPGPGLCAPTSERTTTPPATGCPPRSSSCRP